MARHNTSGLTEPIDATVRTFHERPFRVPGSERIVDALRTTVTDPWLRGLPLFGSIDQFADCTDLLSYWEYTARLHAVYSPGDVRRL